VLGQLKQLRRKLKASTLLLPLSSIPDADADGDGGRASPPAAASSSAVAHSPAPTDRLSTASGGRSLVTGESVAALQSRLRAEAGEKEQALALRTRAVRDLRDARTQLGACHTQMADMQRGLALARVLTWRGAGVGMASDSALGAPMALLRALYTWRAAGGGEVASAAVWTVRTDRAAAQTAIFVGGGRVHAAADHPDASGGAAPRGWQMALRASRLGELRVRVLHRVVLWATRAKSRAWRRWITLTLLSNPMARGWGAGGADLHELLHEVEHMKMQVASVAASPPPPLPPPATPVARSHAPSHTRSTAGRPR
jgi:hypothetical protein